MSEQPPEEIEPAGEKPKRRPGRRRFTPPEAPTPSDTPAAAAAPGPEPRPLAAAPAPPAQPPIPPPALPPPPAMPPLPPPQAAVGQLPPPQPAMVSPPAAYYYHPRTNGSAVGSLVAGISAILLTFVCAILAPIAAIIAIVLARTSRREIRASGGWQTGEGLATAGEVIGWITIALTVLGFVLIVVFLIFLIVGAAVSGGGHVFARGTCYGC